jgi:hypothetical protein
VALIAVLVAVVAVSALPARFLTRWAALAGAALMFALAGVSLAAVFGPTSDTSYHESNWTAKQNGHLFFIIVVALECSAAVVLAAVALWAPRAPAVRLGVAASAALGLVLTLGLAFALSN